MRIIQLLALTCAVTFGGTALAQSFELTTTVNDSTNTKLFSETNTIGQSKQGDRLIVGPMTQFFDGIIDECTNKLVCEGEIRQNGPPKMVCERIRVIGKMHDVGQKDTGEYQYVSDWTGNAYESEKPGDNWDIRLKLVGIEATCGFRPGGGGETDGGNSGKPDLNANTEASDMCYVHGADDQTADTQAMRVSIDFATGKFSVAPGGCTANGG